MNFIIIIKKIIYTKFNLKTIILLFLFLYLFPYKPGYSSFEITGYGARARGMGRAYVGLADTPDAIFLNCSGISQLKSPGFCFFYTRPFGMKELSYFSLAGVVPTSIGDFATGISSFGNEIYQEQTFLLTFSRSLKQTFFYGANLRYMKLQIQGYGSDFCYGLDLGFLVKISQNFNWGFFTTNINRSSLAESKDYLPQSFITGMSVTPLNNIILNIDLYKELPFPLEIRVGFEYLLLNKIALRAGFTSEPAQFCYGLGFVFKHFGCDYAVNTHTDLGLTHQFSFLINF